MLPSDPLTNADDFCPKKNFGVSMLTPLPLKVVSPELCIFNSPFEPLIKFVEFPMLNAEELKTILLPSNFIPSPCVTPI